MCDGVQIGFGETRVMGTCYCPAHFVDILPPLYRKFPVRWRHVALRVHLRVCGFAHSQCGPKVCRLAATGLRQVAHMHGSQASRICQSSIIPHYNSYQQNLSACACSQYGHSYVWKWFLGWGGCVGGCRMGLVKLGSGNVLMLTPLRGHLATIVPDISSQVASCCIVCASACVWFYALTVWFQGLSQCCDRIATGCTHAGQPDCMHRSVKHYSPL